MALAYGGVVARAASLSLSGSDSVMPTVVPHSAQDLMPTQLLYGEVSQKAVSLSLAGTVPVMPDVYPEFYIGLPPIYKLDGFKKVDEEGEQRRTPRIYPPLDF